MKIMMGLVMSVDNNVVSMTSVDNINTLIIFGREAKASDF